MITRPGHASPLPVELRYFDIPRDAWARALLRARQLGARAVAADIPWAWHAPAPDQIDFAGATHPQRDLLALVELCADLGLALVVGLADGAPPGWLAACSAALLPHQAPRGPIAALRLGAGDQRRLCGWLRGAGWAVPIEDGALPAEPGGGWPAADLFGRPGARRANGAAPPLLRADGSARPAFWRAKGIGMLIGAAGSDFAAARAPADLALIACARTEPLARRLDEAGVTFDRIDLAVGERGRLAGYALAVAAERADLAGQANLAWMGAPASTPAPAIPIDDDISAEAISELVEARGGNARYAWADAPEVDVGVRYGAAYTYLSVVNRRGSPYNGMLAYRDASGEVLHLHIGIGAGRSGLVMLQADEVAGAAIDGDGAEGGWLARGLTSSMVFNAGAGAVARCGGALLLAAPQSGRFQIRQGAGWAGARAYRLLLSGELTPARLQTDAAHLLLPYTAEDERGQTDMYLILPERTGLAPELRDYLAAPLRARAAELRYAAELAGQAAPAAAPALAEAADVLAAGARRLAEPGDIGAAWRAAAAPIEAALSVLAGAEAAPAIAAIARLAAGEP